MSTLGFDTSNYTASVAWTDGKTDKSARQLLPVKEGERGIRQSDGVFHHVKLLPELYEQLDADMTSVTAIGVSTRPRNIKGSYMPVFLAGHGYARVAAKTMGVPLYEFSHQDGHIMAGIYSCGAFKLLQKPFLSVHLSGGTTEILRSEYKDINFVNEILGGTRDISAGQLIDRVGVRMGMRFPAGRELEQLALTADKAEKLPVSVDGTMVSFSGVETKTIQLENKTEKSSLALGVLYCVRDTLTKAINHAIEKTGIHDVLVVGGVASNGIIRKGFTEKLNADVYFAKPEYSTDNAVGIAYLAHLAHNS